MPWSTVGLAGVIENTPPINIINIESRTVRYFILSLLEGAFQQHLFRFETAAGIH